jgi:biopolymer transport protein ExbD
VTLEELAARLAARRKESSDLGVLVRGAAAGQFQRIAEVLVACKQAGIQELGIAVMPMPPKK